MTQDHYATLGVTPTSNAAAIRAAYLALMREYHPDKNSSPAAIERAQAIIAAFKVLGDFERRSHYDWDRRREREAAAAQAAPRRRWAGAAPVAAAAIGLAAIGALLSMPSPTQSPRTIEASATEGRAKAVSPPPPTATPARTAKVARPKKVIERSAPAARVVEVAPITAAAPRAKPVRVAAVDPVPPKPKKPERLAAAGHPQAAKNHAPRVALAALSRAKAKPPAPKPTTPAPARASTDLASLDQFVMSFYGQSWRYGDAPKRAVLEQSRATFAARRGACGADACKRAAYLRLMRDVSDIVESGQPRPRRAD